MITREVLNLATAALAPAAGSETQTTLIADEVPNWSEEPMI